MAHIIAIGEGYTDGLKRFEKHFNGKTYCNGKGKVRVREIKLYHFGFNECCKDEVLADIKSLSRYHNEEKFKGQKNTTTELHYKFEKYIKYFRKFFKMIKPIEDDLDRVKSSNYSQEMGKKGIQFNTALTPLGYVDDYRKADGSEAV